MYQLASYKQSFRILQDNSCISWFCLGFKTNSYCFESGLLQEKHELSWIWWLHSNIWAHFQTVLSCRCLSTWPTLFSAIVILKSCKDPSAFQSFYFYVYTKPKMQAANQISWSVSRLILHISVRNRPKTLHILHVHTFSRNPDCDKLF